MLQLALYKGPASTLRNKLGHWLVCTLTLSPYSHVELVIDGVCWSASYRDGGVRPAIIDLTSGHWDVFPIFGDRDKALEWFGAHAGAAYDWPGMLRVCPALRWLPRRGKKFFCSEAVGAALGHPDPETLSPVNVLDVFFTPQTAT